MRPVHITIEGLTAFRQSQSVDLADLDLFVITGPTGAGKTSILDALTFALYGSMVRVKSAEMHDLITHNAAQAKVQLDFEVRGERYRVARVMKRKGQPLASLERLGPDGEYMPVVETSGTRPINAFIVDILGLDFDAFTKAVLLPQGRFQEFLSGNAETRRTILTRLLELERYVQMGALARQKAKDLVIVLEQQERWLELDYAYATAAHLAERENVAQAALAASQSATGLRDQASKYVAAAHASAERASRIEKALEAIRDLALEIGVVEQAARVSEARDQETIEALKSAEARNTAAQAAEMSARTAVQEAVDGAGGDEIELNALLTHARTLATESSKLADTETRLKDLETGLALAGTKEEQALRAVETAQKDVAEAEEDGLRLKEEEEQATRGLELARQKALVAEKTGEVEKLNKALAGAVKKRQDAAERLEHLRIEHRAEGLRTELRAGEPCPVCEQPVQALPKSRPAVGQVVSEAQALLKGSEAEHDRAQENVSRARQELHLVEQSIVDLEPSVPEPLRRLDVADAEKLVSKRTEALETARTSYPAKSEALKHAQNEAQDRGREHHAFEVRLEECRQARDALSERADGARDALVVLFGSPLPDDCEKTLQSRLALLSDARKVERAAQDESAMARTAVAHARAEREALEVATRDGARALDQMRGEARRCASALSEHLESETDLAPPEATSEPLAAQAAALRSFCDATCIAGDEAKEVAVDGVAKAREQLGTIVGQLGIEEAGKTVDELASAIELVHRDLDFQARARQTEVEQLKVQIGKRKEIESGMESEKRRRDLYETLGRELRSDRFLDYVLGESMRTLAVQATAELTRITAGRYSIEARESSFEVVDHENADERRSVATLSGGETFLASLALALALSGSVRDIAGNAAAARLESMFIDEGFGALDSETLDVAVNALEQLAGERRMIGVISHVPALAERIQDGLDVRKVGASSTIVAR